MPEPRLVSIDLPAGELRGPSITIDGLDLVEIVSAFELRADRCSLPELTITVRPSAEFFGDATVRAAVDTEVRDLLIDAGWTPPDHDPDACPGCGHNHDRDESAACEGCACDGHEIISYTGPVR